MLNVAILSFWHVHAKGYTNEIKSRNDCKVVAIWDELEERGQRYADEYQVPFYASLQPIWENPEIDAVVVNAPSNMHPELMIAAAKAGKHIFTEKVLAIHTEGADQILEAVQQNQVKLTVSLPRLGESYVRYAKKVVEQGLLGQVTLVRTRLAHDGALPRAQSSDGWLPPHFYNRDQCGGGALIDLGCHPMYLAHHFLGLPQTVSAQFGYVTGREVEDNAVVTLSYPDGAIAVVEAGFASKHSPFTVEIYGTEGCLLIGQDIQIRSDKLQAHEHAGWMKPSGLPGHLPSPIMQWADYVLYDRQPEITLEQGRALTQLMEASYQSAASGNHVSL